MTQDLTRSLIVTHLARYPEMRITDVYRLLHQSVFGSAEAVSKKKSTKDWLQHEFDLAAASDVSGAGLLESVGLKGEIVRLHLRPYRGAGGATAPLLDAILRTAAAIKGSDAAFSERWNTFVMMINEDKGLAEKFPPREVRLFGKIYEDRHWSVSQHSPQYLYSYKPLYRVLTLEEAGRICQKQKISTN